MEKEELKKRREMLGLTQITFAKKIGVTATTISRYEVGLVPIPRGMALMLEALEVRHVEDMQKTIREGR
jgi:DNA-binding XRE family transcriptional regulator